jgi:hypothetical protein
MTVKKAYLTTASLTLEILCTYVERKRRFITMAMTGDGIFNSAEGWRNLSSSCVC